MEKLVKGFLKFLTEVFGKKKDLFTRISETQAPRALFITWSDSRVAPTLLTQTDPGERFTLRNAGN
ncbi:MAG: Carbonic anhydrase 1 [Nitrospira sp.]|jgi:carbonic anhydrase|nr:Carbonic anhydrase 1 [Nitrospira sp.]